MKNTNYKLVIDKTMQIIFMLISLICASFIVFIIFFILLQGVRPFIIKYPNNKTASLIKFLFSINYDSKTYGILGLVINTLFIVFIASLIALPLSVLTALFIVRIAPIKISKVMESIVELLASIPSIIFGLFGVGFINPLIRDFALLFNLQTAGGVSVLSTIIVLIMMITPTITLLSITSMKAVKDDTILASLALGASKTQTDFKIVVNGAKSGIFAALILGIGRALGEATAVSMVCGGAKTISILLFSPTGTLTSTMMQGFHESSGINYDIRFSIGIVLILIILISNVLLNLLKKRLCRYE